MDVSVCMFFFPNTMQHTRCGLVTGVQTCALPIHGSRNITSCCASRRRPGFPSPACRASPATANALRLNLICYEHPGSSMSFSLAHPHTAPSETRRVGKECVCTYRSTWTPSQYNKQPTLLTTETNTSTHQ